MKAYFSGGSTGGERQGKERNHHEGCRGEKLVLRQGITSGKLYTEVCAYQDVFSAIMQYFITCHPLVVNAYGLRCWSFTFLQFMQFPHHGNISVQK